MKIEGQHTFSAPRDVVWRAVLDPTVLARILPGCEDFKEVGENTYQGTLKIKVGPVQGKFKGDVVLSDLVEPDSYHLSVKGKGAPGFVDGQGIIELKDGEEAETTALVYSVEAKVGGRIATVGQRLLDSSAKVITRQSLEGLESYLSAETEAVAAEAEAEAAEAAAEDGKGEAGDDGTPEGDADASAEAEAGPTETGDASAERAEAEAAAARRAAAARAEAAAARQRAASARAAVEDMQPPSQAEFAARFLKEMFEEVVPEEQRGKVGLGIAAAFLVLLAILMKGC